MSSLTGIAEPRLAFNRIVVLRYRSHLESRQLAPGTINLRLDAVRRLAYEAADCGLLSADLAAGIRRVKGVKKLGIRLGNWLTAEQGNALWQAPDRQRLKGKRDRALPALLLACGLRRHEAVALTLDHLQQREEHWAIVDLVGKGGHIRTVPVPDWVRAELNDWLTAAAIDRGRLFRMTQSLRALLLGQGVTVHAVFLGPVDTDMNRGFDIPKASPESAAQGIFDGLEKGEEDIFPNPTSLSVADGWRMGVAKALERQFAAFVPERR